MPCKRGLLRGRQPGRQRRARGRAGRSQPRPPPRFPRQRLRRRLSGLDPRRPAASSPSPATARSLATPTPMAGAAPRGREAASRARSMRRSAGQPIITRIMSSLLGPDPGQERHRRRAHFYRWAGGWGQPAAFSDAYAGREPTPPRFALRRSPREDATRRASRGSSPKRSKIPGAEPLTLAPSMRGEKGVAVRFNLVAREASRTRRRRIYQKFDASDNLSYSLSSDGARREQQPLGKPVAHAARQASAAKKPRPQPH